MTDKTRQIVDYAYEDEAKDVRDSVYSAIHDKVMSHIETKKQEIAQGLMNQIQAEPADENA